MRYGKEFYWAMTGSIQDLFLKSVNSKPLNPKRPVLLFKGLGFRVLGHRTKPKRVDCFRVSGSGYRRNRTPKAVSNQSRHPKAQK